MSGPAIVSTLDQKTKVGGTYNRVEVEGWTRPVAKIMDWGPLGPLRTIDAITVQFSSTMAMINEQMLSGLYYTL